MASFEQLRQHYLATFDDKIAGIKKALADENWQELAGLIHKLTGSSGSYGLTHVFEQCEVVLACLDDHKKTSAGLSLAIDGLIHSMRAAQQ